MKLTEEDKRRFEFNYEGHFNNTEMRITISDKLSTIKKEILFVSPALMTTEAIESIFKENIEVIKIEARDCKINQIIK